METILVSEDEFNDNTGTGQFVGFSSMMKWESLNVEGDYYWR